MDAVNPFTRRSASPCGALAGSTSPGPWWLRFPADALVRGARSELFVARAMWFAALPAQCFVLQFYLSAQNALIESILFSITCLLTFILVGQLISALRYRVLHKKTVAMSLTASIVLCWIGATIIHAVLLYFLHDQPVPVEGTRNFDYLVSIVEVGIERVASEEISRKLHHPNGYVVLTGVSAITTFASCFIIVVSVALLRLLATDPRAPHRFVRLSAPSTRAKANPSVVLVWLATCLPLGAIYYFALMTEPPPWITLPLNLVSRLGGG